MTIKAALAVTVVIAVGAYYIVAWLSFRKGRRGAPVLPLYGPPRQLSPAMLRYIWKEEFDDRTFWAGMLSLVAKGLATLHSSGGAAFIRATPSRNEHVALSKEEEILFDELVRGHTRKDFPIGMLTAKTRLAVSDMAESLRREAIGRWFTENRVYLIGGVVLSAIGLSLVANPRNTEEWAVLAYSIALTAPGAYYLLPVSFRAWDVLYAARESMDWKLVRREALLVAMLLPCLASIAAGGVIIGVTFGWQAVAVALCLAALGAFSSKWVKAPTQEGGQVLTEIEGFRLFLKSVEQLPMQRTDEPTDHVGVYEKYLPYAVALEVEQAWGDRLVALTSTYHESAGIPGAETFYLGMWNGKPLDIVYRPETPKGRSAY